MNAGDANEFQRITKLLGEAQSGRAEALQAVADLVYPELVRRAAAQLRRYYGDRDATPTLEPAALVNETYLRLIRQRSRFDSRGHFFAIASKLMLRVLIDHERARGRQKRGGAMIRVSLSEASELPATDQIGIEEFAEVLERLETLDSRAADVVKARLIWGLSPDEIAKSFALSRRTVERDLDFARRWLEVELVRAY